MTSQSPQDLGIGHVELLVVLMSLPRVWSADKRKCQVTGKISRAKSCMVLTLFVGGACMEMLWERRINTSLTEEHRGGCAATDTELTLGGCTCSRDRD